MSENSAPLLVITGPTGIGKTELAMALSDQAPLALISADSVMVYQDLDIGSAKPSPIELAQYPHALVDIVPPEHPFDAGQFVLHAETAIAKAWNEGMIPCLVGGTIMYLKALLDGLDQLPEADPRSERRFGQLLIEMAGRLRINGLHPWMQIWPRKFIQTTRLELSGHWRSIC